MLIQPLYILCSGATRESRQPNCEIDKDQGKWTVQTLDLKNNLIDHISPSSNTPCHDVWNCSVRFPLNEEPLHRNSPAIASQRKRRTNICQVNKRLFVAFRQHLRSMCCPGEHPEVYPFRCRRARGHHQTCRQHATVASSDVSWHLL
jgi:hypothetical protein